MKHKILIIVILLTIFFTSNSYSHGDDQLSVIKDLYSKGRIAEAERSLLKLYSDNPELIDPKHLLSMGYDLLMTAKTIEAEALLLTSTHLFPESSDIYLILARAYRANGHDDKELQALSKGFEIKDKENLKSFLSNKDHKLKKTAEEVIDRHLNAIGGKEKLLKIKTMSMTFSLLDSTNRKEFIKRYYKAPDLICQEFVDTHVKNVTDGKTVWQVTQDGIKELPDHSMVHMPDIYTDFIDYRKKGINYRLEGIVSLDHQIYYHLIKEYSDGESQDYYFSAETGLLMIARRIFGAGKDIQRFYDYRDVEGLLFPHILLMTVKVGLGQAHGVIVNDIKINPSLPDSLFNR